MTAAFHSPSSSRRIRSTGGGFSLVELIICVSIIGLIVAMAIPSVAGIVDSSTSAKSQRQAQIIAQTYASACAAGAVFANSQPETVIEALTQTAGVRGKGIFADLVFTVTMTAAEKSDVVRSKALVTHSLPDGTTQLVYRPSTGR